MELGDSTVLVPVDLSEETELSSGLVSLLERVDVVLLGYYPTPAQTTPSQLRETRSDDARRRLSAVAGQFASADGELVTRLVFTHDQQDPIDRIATEKHCDAVLVPGDGTGETLERILVPLRGKRNADRILSVVADLLGDEGASVTVFHVLEGEGTESSETLLEAARDGLVDRGVDASRIETGVSDDGEPAATISREAGEFDLIVSGESEPASRKNVLGGLHRLLQPSLTVPQIVVRSEPEDG